MRKKSKALDHSETFLLLNTRPLLYHSRNEKSSTQGIIKNFKISGTDQKENILDIILGIIVIFALYFFFAIIFFNGEL